jgi:hypothetical protein
MEAIHLFYMKCYALAMLGVALNILVKMNGVRTKALNNNLIWSYRDYFYKEVWAIVANCVAVFIAMFFVKDMSVEFGKEWVTLLFLLLSGFIGSEFIVRLLGSANKIVNNAVAYKTKIADDATNNSEKPTPVQ